MSQTLLQVSDLKRYFRAEDGGEICAVDGVSFTIAQGEIFGLVGESGSGKTTVGRLIAGFDRPTSGKIFLKGRAVTPPKVFRKQHAEICRTVQMIFQDPNSSVNARMTAAQIVEEPLLIQKICANKAERRKRVEELLHLAGLADNSLQERYPAELSGGQLQRVCIARALAMDPLLLVADEPLSALDVSIQAQVGNLLKKLQQERGMACLLIAHDLAMLRRLSDRVGVLYRGCMVEMAATEELYRNPLHPYTKALISAIPAPDPNFRPKGSAFLPERDFDSAAPMREVAPGHFVKEKI